jgi:hypothetical protein
MAGNARHDGGTVCAPFPGSNWSEMELDDRIVCSNGIFLSLLWDKMEERESVHYFSKSAPLLLPVPSVTTTGSTRLLLRIGSSHKFVGRLLVVCKHFVYVPNGNKGVNGTF